VQEQVSRVPVSLPSDPIEVSEALDIARALWDKGDSVEAVRWIRRAVEAADEAGDVQRMAALARGAADLEESIAHSDPASKLPASVPRSAPTPVPTRPSTAPSVRPTTNPPPSSIRLNRSKPPPLPAAAARPSQSPPAATRASHAPPRIQPPPPSSPAPRPPPGGIRVSVKTSVRDPALLVVRRLAQGQAAPAGAHEALLVLPEGASLELLEAPRLNGKGSR
jgi:hypothetical protein